MQDLAGVELACDTKQSLSISEPQFILLEPDIVQSWEDLELKCYDSDFQEKKKKKRECSLFFHNWSHSVLGFLFPKRKGKKENSQYGSLVSSGFGTLYLINSVTSGGIGQSFEDFSSTCGFSPRCIKIPGYIKVSGNGWWALRTTLDPWFAPLSSLQPTKEDWHRRHLSHICVCIQKCSEELNLMRGGKLVVDRGQWSREMEGWH